jgi:S-formylglutathione hydrolase FrmB
MRGLHQKLTELGIPHEWSTAPGGHTWKYWSSVLPQMLKFHLAAGPAAEHTAKHISEQRQVEAK